MRVTNAQNTAAVPVKWTPSMPVDTNTSLGVNSIAETAASMHLSRCEMRVIRKMRELTKCGKSYILIIMGNDAGVRMCETLPPEWEPK